MKGKKTLAVLSTAALLAGVSPVATAPVASSVAEAATAGTISALNVPTYAADDAVRALGTVKVVVPAGSKTAGQKLIVSLGKGKFADDTDTVVDPATDPVDVDAIKPTTPNGILVPDKINGVDNGIKVTANEITAKYLENNKIEITFNADVSLTNDLTFFIVMDKVAFSESDSGAVEVTLDASPNSGIPSGKVTVANIGAEGTATLTVSGQDTSNNVFTFDLKVREPYAGVVGDGDTITVKLPRGYKFDSFSTVNNAQTYGDPITLTQEDLDENTIKIKVTRSTSNKDTYFTIPLKFRVVDYSLVKPGDIVALVDADFNIDTEEVVVGTYGEYGVTVTAKSAPEIWSGKKEQKIGTLEIKEGLPGTLIEGRTVTLTLPEGVKWVKYKDSTTSETLKLTNARLANDNRTLIYDVQVNAPDDSDKFTTKAATVSLKDLEVNVAADFVGDVEVEIGGTAGVTGKVVLAKVNAPVEMTVSNVADLKVGLSGQQLGDIVIKEKVKGAFENISGQDVILELSDGEFDGTPNVVVTEGDLVIEKVSVDRNVLSFNVKSSSLKPSTIKITGAKVKLYRSVPEGDVTLALKGGDLVTTDFTNRNTAAKVTVAKVVTPAPTEQKATVVFTIDNTKYTVNGVEKTADVAPYIKDGRTFLPVRYVAEALGVSSDNILWDPATKTVTLFKGDRVVKLTIGSKVLTVNGTTITMDVAPEIKNGRTMLPIRWVGTALGVKVEWDEQARTVTVQQ